MKEIWLEKLIELLDEYENTLEPNLQIEWTEVWIKSTPEIVISNKFWFIKWLVDNNKIERDNQALQYAKSDLSKFFAEWKDKKWMSDDYAMLLMLLSIQDEPIRFLISVLK